ncbi:hypothetical protein NFI96_022635, partial [Prochilodus magdalenae]
MAAKTRCTNTAQQSRHNFNDPTGPPQSSPVGSVLWAASCGQPPVVHPALALASGASIDRYESEKPAQATVIHLLRTSEVQNEKRPVEDSRHVDYKVEEEEEYYYDDDEYEYELSGDYETPRVAFSSKPKDPGAVLETERLKGKKKGKGKKRNPCLKKYKDFCIHGTCQYLRKIGPSCICNPGYSGERCHSFSLPVWNPEGGYNRTTALAVVAVVLSSLCLTIIGLLLALRMTQDYIQTDRYDDGPYVTLTKDCSGVVPDCHGVTQNGSGSSLVTSPALVLVETPNKSVCGGTVVSTKMNCVLSHVQKAWCHSTSTPTAPSAGA